jgi:hypothetical protein
MIVEPELLPNVLEAISSSPGILDLSNIFIFNTRGQSVPKKTSDHGNGFYSMEKKIGSTLTTSKLASVQK